MSEYKIHAETADLILTEVKSGFWLYDRILGMNLSMRAESKDEAFLEALKYYQRRLMEVESELYTINRKVDKFIKEVLPESEEPDGY